MEKQLKLIWDFRGLDSEKTAEHHTTHLKEYVRQHQKSYLCGHQKINHSHSVAFLVVPENEMKPIRDQLRPHRGEWYTPSDAHE